MRRGLEKQKRPRVGTRGRVWSGLTTNRKSESLAGEERGAALALATQAEAVSSTSCGLEVRELRVLRAGLAEIHSLVSVSNTSGDS